MNEVLIMIPAYNEEGNIEGVVDHLIAQYPQYDYVVINDGSTDRTSALCHQRGYSIIDLPVNLGLAAAFQTGLKYAYKKGYAYALQFDGDGQHLPQYIEPLYRKIKEGYDIVIGSRFLGHKKPLSLRMLGSRLISAAIRLTSGCRITDPTSGMRMFSRTMIREFSLNINYGPEPDTISFLIKNGATIAEVPVVMEEREAGTSYLGVSGSIMYMLRMLNSILLIQNFRIRTKR